MRRPKVTALICAYWPSRFANLPAIIQDLRTSTVCPDSILVLNNNPKASLLRRSDAAVINAGHNFTSRGKYPAALLEPADYYLLLDDDVSVMPELLGTWLEMASPGCCYCDVGCRMVSNMAHQATVIRATQISTPTKADLFQGSLQLVSHGAAVRYLAAEELVRLPDLPRYRTVGEDLLIALANPDRAFVLPCADQRNRKHQPQQNVAMQEDDGYYQIRDLFFYHAWLRLGRPPFPGRTPDDSDSMRWVERYEEITRRRDEEGLAK